MNQDHAQLHAIRDRLKGGHGMGPEHINMLNLHKEMAISRHHKENGEEPKERPVCIHYMYIYKRTNGVLSSFMMAFIAAKFNT